MKAKFLVLATVAAGCVAALPAYAHTTDFRNGHQQRNYNKDVVTTPTTAAPEIDPGMAAGALTLLAGGLAVVRGRRRKDG